MSEAMILSLYNVHYTEHLNGRSANYVLRSYIAIPLAGWRSVT